MIVVIGSGGRVFAPPPPHTTGHAVFRIRRLNLATLTVAKSGSINHPLPHLHSAPSPFSLSPKSCSLRDFASRGNTTHLLTPPRVFSSVSPFRRLTGTSWRRLKWPVSWFFGPSLRHVSVASSLLRPLLTSPKLSSGRSPQVRC